MNKIYAPGTQTHPLMGSTEGLSYKRRQTVAPIEDICKPPFSLGMQGHCPQVISILEGDFEEMLCTFKLFKVFSHF